MLELTQVLKKVETLNISTGIYAGLLTAKDSNQTFWFSAQAHQGFIQVQQILKDPVASSDLHLRVSRAAQAAGFTREDAWRFAAAIGEICDNVIDHSERIESGYIAYAISGKAFEFVVADTGIGVLESLRKNPNYSWVSESGTALELSLSEGVSRYAELGHGLGFRPILVGLANLSTRIRFRSGDYCRELQRKTDGTIPANTSQLARIDGLFCSVLCNSDI